MRAFAANGDGVDRYEGFREFVQNRGQALSRTAYLLCGDHGAAEDLVQSALAKTAARWPTVRAAGSPEAYVRRVMVNERISWWRRRRHVEHPTGDLPERPSPGDESERVVRRITVAAALAQLAPRQRAVIVLRFYEDLSEAEAAAALGCGVGTVKRQTHDALARLRRIAPELAPRWLEEQRPARQTVPEVSR